MTLKRIGRFFVFLLSVFIFISIVWISRVSAETSESFDKKRVLYISSYSSAFNTFYQQIEGLKDVFDGYPVVVDMEFMDSKRFFTEENISNFYNSLAYKLNYVSYDAIMTSDDNALNFVMENKSVLFDQVPVVFFGVNNEENAENYVQDPLVTGVVESVSFAGTIDFATQLFPEASRVVALSDATVSGQADLDRFYEFEDEFSDFVFDDIDMGQMSIDNFLSELSLVDDDSVIILLSALKDVEGQTWDFSESLELINQYANVPVFHLFEHGIGDGLIGGSVVSQYLQATTAGEMVLSIFFGKDVSEIDLVNDMNNRFLIDYELYKDYDLDFDLLPNSTEFVNRNLSFYDRYELLVQIVIGVLFFLSLVIVALGFVSHYRNIARIEAEKAKGFLEASNKSLTYTAYHDELTGLNNRRYFDEQTRSISIIDKRPVILLMGDVNGLKILNDAFGHLCGDQALIRIAGLLEDIFPNDLIARIGGDEYAVVCLGESKDVVVDKVRELRRKVAQVRIEGVQLSLSLGFAVEEGDMVIIDNLYKAAENAMYREKMYQVPSNRTAIIDTIIATLNQKDAYSELHSKRVAMVSLKIGDLMGLDDETISRVKTAGILHDIGKIVVPSSILMKEGKLTNSEYDEIKKHSEIGFRILSSVSSLKYIAEIVFCHHERMDGRGYPRGLMGDKIPLESRIISVADAIDAMLTDRLYRLKLSKEACYQELLDNRGSQFCPKVVDVVIKNFDQIYDLILEEVNGIE